MPQMLWMAKRDIDPGVSGNMVRRIYRMEKLPAKDGNRWNLIIPDDKVDDFMKLIPGRQSKEIQRLAKETLGLDLTMSQIRSWKKNHKTPSGYDTRFRPGHIPDIKGKKWNEFMTPEAQKRSRLNQFKKGNIPKNRKEVGDIYLRNDGYLWIKVRDYAKNQNWQQYHRYIWEQANGPIPKGHVIIFLDGNRQNCKLENLTMVSEKVVAVANKWYGLTDDPDINRAILSAAELRHKVTSATERSKDKDERSKRKSGRRKAAADSGAA